MNLEKIKSLLLKVLIKINPCFLTRPMIKFIANQNKKDLIGVEIGVDKGLNALTILKTLHIKKLYLIDIYKPFTVDGITHDNTNAYKIAKENLAKYKDKIEFVIKKSEESITEIPNELDFVYVDGDHSYEGAKKDIELYYPKVKEGGIIGGDDFSIYFPGVARAVTEFCKDKKLYGDKTDWWIVK